MKAAIYFFACLAFVVGCHLLKPAANALSDIAFNECLARAETEAEVIACTAGREITKEMIDKLVAAKRVGMAKTGAIRDAGSDR